MLSDFGDRSGRSGEPPDYREPDPRPNHTYPGAMPRLPRSTRTLSRATAVLACGLLLAATTACGGDDEPTAADQLADRAAKGLTASYTASYTLSSSTATPTTSASPTATATVSKPGAGLVLVARTPDALRLDVTTATGVATSIRTAESTIACQSPTGGKTPTCLTVAGAGAAPPAAFDPGLRRLFDDTLRAFSEDTDTFTVTEAPGVSAAGVDAACFTVAPVAPVESQEPGASASATAAVAAGTYCLSEDGVPVQATFASGTATLTTLRNETVGPDTFVPPATPTALPNS
jgi:hypothetical protein